MGGTRLRGLGLNFKGEKIYGEVFEIEGVNFIYHADTKSMIKVKPDTIKYMVNDTVNGEELYVGDIVGNEEYRLRVESFLEKTQLIEVRDDEEINAFWFRDFVELVTPDIRILERVYESPNTY